MTLFRFARHLRSCRNACAHHRGRAIELRHGREGYVRRLTIFAKGNLDVRDTLHALRLADQLVWNGVNEILRARNHGVVARVRHETWTRSDALLDTNATVPQELAERALALGAYPATSQFSRALFETAADAVVLSIQPDLTN